MDRIQSIQLPIMREGLILLLLDSEKLLLMLPLHQHRLMLSLSLLDILIKLNPQSLLLHLKVSAYQATFGLKLSTCSTKLTQQFKMKPNVRMRLVVFAAFRIRAPLTHNCGESGALRSNLLDQQTI